MTNVKVRREDCGNFLFFFSAAKKKNNSRLMIFRDIRIGVKKISWKKKGL